MYTIVASAVCRLLYWTEVSPYELKAVPDVAGAAVIITYCLNEKLPNGEIPYQGLHLALYQTGLRQWLGRSLVAKGTEVGNTRLILLEWLKPRLFYYCECPSSFESLQHSGLKKRASFSWTSMIII